MALLIQAQGQGGEVDVYDEKIAIRRKGVLAFLNHGMKGDKEVPISKITSIQFKQAGTFINGYIQFSLPGGNESRGGAWAATKDENTIMFTKQQAPNFEKAKEMLDKKIYDNPDASSKSGFDEIEKLAELKKKGIITKEEFEAKKKQLLGV